MSERRGNPFGWIFLGFIIGVLATFGTLLFLSAGDGGYEEGPAEVRTAADDALADAMIAEDRPKPRASDPVIPPEQVATPTTPGDRPPVSSEPLDPQVADDAAAAGMTSRAR